HVAQTLVELILHIGVVGLRAGNQIRDWLRLLRRLRLLLRELRSLLAARRFLQHRLELRIALFDLIAFFADFPVAPRRPFGFGWGGRWLRRRRLLFRRSGRFRCLLVLLGETSLLVARLFALRRRWRFCRRSFRPLWHLWRQRIAEELLVRNSHRCRL